MSTCHTPIAGCHLKSFRLPGPSVKMEPGVTRLGMSSSSYWNTKSVGYGSPGSGSAKVWLLSTTASRTWLNCPHRSPISWWKIVLEAVTLRT